MNVKYELQTIISGTGDHATTDIIQAAAHYLRESKKTGRNAQEPELSKEQVTKRLIVYFTLNPQKIITFIS